MTHWVLAPGFCTNSVVEGENPEVALGRFSQRSPRFIGSAKDDLNVRLALRAKMSYRKRRKGPLSLDPVLRRQADT